MAHQTDGHLVSEFCRHHGSKCHHFPHFPHQRDWLREYKIAPESGDRKALLASRGILAEPGIRDELEFVQDRGNLFGRDYLELKAVSLPTLQGIAEISPLGALQSERWQENTRFFAKLQNLETSVEIERQARCRYLIESSPATVAIGKFDETPHQF